MATNKLHRPLYEGIVGCLQDIFIHNRYADKVIERTFKMHREWGSRDRAIVAEAVYNIVRNWRLITSVLGREGQPYSAGHWDQCIQAYYYVTKVALPDYPWSHPISAKTVLTALNSLITEPAYLYSIPDWLYIYGERQLGLDAWVQEIAAMHQQAPINLRVNTLKTTVDQVADDLAKSGIRTSKLPDTEHALALTQGRNVFTLPSFKLGWFEVQDSGSQQVGAYCANFLGPLVIDACAGAGGKTLHLAALMSNKGKILALDVDQYKLDILKQRARRAGVFNIETRLIDADKTIKKLANKADLLLLDAPCSGSGVWRRNPDAKWKTTPESLEKAIALQKEILNKYASMVKPGGSLVYATCSLFPSENMDQVNNFLAHHPDFHLKDYRQLTTAKDATDGFFMARMLRQDNSPPEQG